MESRAVKQHLVSKGYQKNFADGKRKLSIVSVIDASIAKQLRPTKPNWVKDDWNSFTQADGELNAQLETEFSKLENSALPVIRSVRAANLTETQRGAIVSLFAMHLVRSEAFAEFRAEHHGPTMNEIILTKADDVDYRAQITPSGGPPMGVT